MPRNVTPNLPPVTVWQPFRWLWCGAFIGLAFAASTAPAAESVGQRQQDGPSAAATTSPGLPNANRGKTRPAARSPKVDHAVMPAGGGHAEQSACSQCRRSACPQCRLPEGRQHGHQSCPHGLCPAHCPVRPDVFGFYGTRWRRWPGSGVVQASNDEAVTPVPPPKAEVPGPREESLEPDPAAEAMPAPAAVSMEIEHDHQDQVEPDHVEEVASNTAWRSFTATERRKQSVQP